MGKENAMRKSWISFLSVVALVFMTSTALADNIGNITQSGSSSEFLGSDSNNNKGAIFQKNDDNEGYINQSGSNNKAQINQDVRDQLPAEGPVAPAPIGDSDTEIVPGPGS